jgi:hypothetical protein
MKLLVVVFESLAENNRTYALATALLIRPLIHTGLPRSFAPTLTKRLASSAIVDSIDLMPNPKPLNKFNVNALCSFHGCAAANPVPRIKNYIFCLAPS